MYCYNASFARPHLHRKDNAPSPYKTLVSPIYFIYSAHIVYFPFIGINALPTLLQSLHNNLYDFRSFSITLSTS